LFEQHWLFFLHGWPSLLQVSSCALTFRFRSTNRHHEPSAAHLTPALASCAPSPVIVGVDQVRAFHTSRVGLEEPPLPGYELVFALGNQLVVVTVEVGVPDQPAALAQAEAIARDVSATPTTGTPTP